MSKFWKEMLEKVAVNQVQIGDLYTQRDEDDYFYVNRSFYPEEGPEHPLIHTVLLQKRGSYSIGSGGVEVIGAAFTLEKAKEIAEMYGPFWRPWRLEDDLLVAENSHFIIIIEQTTVR